jgi:hypothetical protein
MEFKVQSSRFKVLENRIIRPGTRHQVPIFYVNKITLVIFIISTV